MLRALEVDVVHIQEVLELGAEASDEAWIEWTAKEHRIALTLDRKIRTKPSEKRVFETSGARVVFVPGGFHDLGLFRQAVWLMNRWEAIEKETAKAKPGECFTVRMQGQIDRLK
jgi:hypothetical protein